MKTVTQKIQMSLLTLIQTLIMTVGEGGSIGRRRRKPSMLGSIMRRNGESIADAALRNQTMTHRPFRTATNNLVTLEDEVQNYYQQVHYQEESEEYESDEDEGPYWRTALHTAKHHNTYEDEEYEYEEEDEGCDDIYYQAYPAERTSTRISEARDKSSKLPMKPQPKSRFEGVFPPPRKNPVKPTQNTFHKPEFSKPRQLPPTPAPTPVPRPQPIQPKPKPVTIIPRPQYPVDARKPRITEDEEMREPP